MSDAVQSPDAKKPDEKADQSAVIPKDAEASKNAGGPEASKDDSTNPAEKQKTKQSSKGGKIGD